MKFLNWIFVVIGVLGLISVRFLENSLFYDPFLDFFKGNYRIDTRMMLDVSLHVNQKVEY